MASTFNRRASQLATGQSSTVEPTSHGRRRVLILDVRPQVDGGRYAVSRIIGEDIQVSCDIVSDGHDLVAGALQYSSPSDSGTSGTSWTELALTPVGNDRWQASFSVSQLGRARFRIHAWVDEFATWRHGLERKHAAGQDITLELAAGVELIDNAVERASGADAEQLARLKDHLSAGDLDERVRAALSDVLAELMSAHPNREHATQGQQFEVRIEPELARFSSWYELFPRSFGGGGQHGTFADVTQKLLPYVASLGFDVLYLPPIHPIGKAFRKGPNNTLTTTEGDPGSPWAIGSEHGGHKEIHPQLGTVEDFEHLVVEARKLGIEVALDIAFQASPDHPYVKAHPEWFVHRADGSIQYAENPPKKYEDVYPFDLAGPAWQSLWPELVSVFEVWIERGVRVFRVDNPHTKPIPFWEYCIMTLKERHPDVIFLAEAFTRPKLMYALAKVGFSQSYTYFTWRTTARELRRYMEELTTTEAREFFRPNFWPNTPDILPEHLQYGGRPMFISRLLLAGTLCSNWGIYGPAFELMEHEPRPGAEEYIDNEKYQLRDWQLDAPHSLAPMVARLNRIRQQNRAFQTNDTLRFHDCDNDNILAYSKSDEATGNVVLTVVSLEPNHRHSGWLTLDLSALMVDTQEVFQVHDQVSDARYHWQGKRVYVELDPEMPGHVFVVKRRVRSEHNFEYFL